MSIFLRIWLAFAIVLLVGSYFTLSAMQNQIKPSVRQVVEEILADNANIIATLIAADVANGQVQTPEFQQKMQQILSRKLDAKIWNQQKDSISQQLYITNSKGIVLYDSQGLTVGHDYSRWNDVYLTLRGHYGVRSTRTNPNDASTSTMYVAAPILWQGQLIGVLSLAKPGISVQPYIDRAQHEMMFRALWIVLLSLIVSGGVAWWLRHGIEQVRRYALAFTPRSATESHPQDSGYTSSKPAKPLRFWIARELNDLTKTIDDMREALAGKAYVENYVHTLTHELKSPLTAIAASAELLQDDLPTADRLRFAENIHEQTERLQLLIERLLLLTRLEKQQDHLEQPLDRESVLLIEQFKQLLHERSALIQTRQLLITLDIPNNTTLNAEPFWLGQALGNLLDNAIDFTPQGGRIHISVTLATAQDPHLRIQIQNNGQAIPDYALPQVFDRYFSLPRPGSGRKSTGIGLTLVREVMALHHGYAQIENIADGVLISLYFKQN
ncbi:two-component system sensor histidine kinase CreC [Aquirhabdus sp.]|uniref:two-component system sensor histidine kinase CreC n=1 Tax=Aquirhabdus sp. TaxID=2824160 RepID=UPI00396C92F5